ncbi:hypothetical protein ES707_15807 [subsurface metagenome]
MPQQVQDKTGHGLIITFRKIKFHLFVHFIDAHTAVNLKGIFVDDFKILFRFPQLVAHLTDDFLDQPAQADDAGGAAVLIDDDAHAKVPVPHFSKQDVDVLGLRGEIGGAGQLINGTLIGNRVFGFGHEHVLDGENADHVIHVFLVDGEAGERRLGIEGKEVGDSGPLFDGDDLRPGHHDLTDGTVAEVEYLVQHICLKFFHGPCSFTEGNHGADFLGAGERP